MSEPSLSFEPPLPRDAGMAARAERYDRVRASIDALLEGEDDWVAAMATVVCELSHAFAHFHWTGFYRAAAGRRLVVGPYQGTHGCLRIDFSRGVCGAAARTRATQLVPDVEAFPGHIACASSTRSRSWCRSSRPTAACWRCSTWTRTSLRRSMRSTRNASRASARCSGPGSVEGVIQGGVKSCREAAAQNGRGLLHVASRDRPSGVAWRRGL